MRRRPVSGATLVNVRPLGVLENLYTYNGNPGHEIILVYEGELAEKELRLRADLKISESNGVSYPVRWVSEQEVREGWVRVYPEGLVAYLGGKGNASPSYP